MTIFISCSTNNPQINVQNQIITAYSPSFSDNRKLTWLFYAPNVKQALMTTANIWIRVVKIYNNTLQNQLLFSNAISCGVETIVEPGFCC